MPYSQVGNPLSHQIIPNISKKNIGPSDGGDNRPVVPSFHRIILKIVRFQTSIIKNSQLGNNYFSPNFSDSYFKLRTACTNEDDFEGRFWCATKVDSNLESIGDFWGYCSGSCPLENQNQNGAPKTVKTTTVAPSIFRKRTTTKAPIQKVRTGNWGFFPVQGGPQITLI